MFCLLCFTPSESVLYVSPRFLLIYLQILRLFLAFWPSSGFDFEFDLIGLGFSLNAGCAIGGEWRSPWNVTTSDEVLMGSATEASQTSDGVRMAVSAAKGVSAGLQGLEYSKSTKSSPILQLQFSRCHFPPFNAIIVTLGLEKSMNSAAYRVTLLLIFAHIYPVVIKKKKGFFCSSYKNSLIMP